MLTLLIFLFAPSYVEVNMAEFSIPTTIEPIVEEHDCPCEINAQKQSLHFTCTTPPTCTVRVADKKPHITVTYPMAIIGARHQADKPFNWKTSIPLAAIAVIAVLIYFKRHRLQSQ